MCPTKSRKGNGWSKISDSDSSGGHEYPKVPTICFLFEHIPAFFTTDAQSAPKVVSPSNDDVELSAAVQHAQRPYLQTGVHVRYWISRKARPWVRRRAWTVWSGDSENMPLLPERCSDNDASLRFVWSLLRCNSFSKGVTVQWGLGDFWGHMFPVSISTLSYKFVYENSSALLNNVVIARHLPSKRFAWLPKS